MNEERRALAARVHAAAAAHDADEPDRLRRHRVLEPATAELLALLVRATRARRILELGTSIGHSTLWLADAAEATGGSVVSVDLDAERSRSAAAALAAADLASRVELRVEDAADTLRRSPDAHWELVFLDAERPQYPAYAGDLLRSLAPAGLLAVDNAISQATELEPFLPSLDRFERTLVPVGAGLLLALAPS